jgi:apolipoprotein D and lipocalin family protein
MKNRNTGKLVQLVCLALLAICAGCTGSPDGVEPVEDFDLDRYLGTWYEIARLDHRFERGLSNVTASYSTADDGYVRVVNRGFDEDAGEWDESVGKARFSGPADTGQLEVSFFGPFYGGYNVIALDQEGYRWSLVAGPTRSYLWLLARTPDLDQQRIDALVAEAERLGFPIGELIFVEHDDPPPP